MSSATQDAKCLSIEGCVAEIEIGPTTASLPHFSFSPFYALALLHDSVQGLLFERLSGRAPPPAPLESEISVDAIIDLSSEDPPSDRKLSIAHQYIASVAYSTTRNWVPRMCKRSDRGLYEEAVSTQRTDADRDLFRAANQALCAVYDAAIEKAEAETGSDEVGDEALRIYERDMPYATIRIEVTDPRWIAHLRVGYAWDVYAFDYAAGCLL